MFKMVSLAVRWVPSSNLWCIFLDSSIMQFYNGRLDIRSSQVSRDTRLDIDSMIEQCESEFKEHSPSLQVRSLRIQLEYFGAIH